MPQNALDATESEKIWFDALASDRKEHMRCCAGELLLAVGAPPHTKGFRLLQYGIMLLAEQPLPCRIGLCETLYPLLERLADGNVSAEHAMRDTIHKTQQRNAPLYLWLFRSERTPTNATFLYTMSACLRRRLSAAAAPRRIRMHGFWITDLCALSEDLMNGKW